MCGRNIILWKNKIQDLDSIYGDFYIYSVDLARFIKPPNPGFTQQYFEL